jgi:chemotaxis response regulator CheB
LLKLMFAFSWDDPSAISIVCLAMPQRVIDALLPNLVKDLGRRMQSLVPDAFLEPGVCYLVSSDSCFRLVNEDSRVKVAKEVESGGPLRPLDCLLGTASRSFSQSVTASILSGVGDDGLVGVQTVKQQGGRAFVLTPEVCLKPEFPRRLLERGWAEEVRTVAEMASLLWGGK